MPLSFVMERSVDKACLRFCVSHAGNRLHPSAPAERPFHSWDNVGAGEIRNVYEAGQRKYISSLSLTVGVRQNTTKIRKYQETPACSSVAERTNHWLWTAITLPLCRP